MEATTTIKLSRPLTLPGAEALGSLSEITLREPDVADLIKAGAAGGSTNWAKIMVGMISSQIGKPEAMVRRMSSRDFSQAAFFLFQYYGKVRETPEDAEPDLTSKTIALQHPVLVDGQPALCEITIREPTIDDLIAGAEHGFGTATNAAVLARMANVAVSQIHKMSATDYYAVAAWLTFFTEGGSSPAISEATSPT